MSSALRKDLRKDRANPGVRALPQVTVVQGDITHQPVDAIVNAANRAMRGGGGVDGAIHRAGGPAILRDCIARFPNGLRTGDAGWTTAGDLRAKWVIHAVGPDFRSGETDRALLDSCYRRSLQVADELGARTVAFPLIGAGVYGWPKQDAIDAALETIWGTDTLVEAVNLVAFDDATRAAMRFRQGRGTPRRILEAVGELHARGFEQVRIHPGMSASGLYWHVSIATADNFDESSRFPTFRNQSMVVDYTTGSGPDFLDATVDEATEVTAVADLIVAAWPWLSDPVSDPDYAAWYRRLIGLVAEYDSLPIAYAEYFDDSRGWEVGWGSGVLIEPPPRALRGDQWGKG
ncbi:O-acetyl-ADP-ribose deacetylase [Microbacterium sp. BWT-B31]|uniref:O-acetyl-ADP-ribose deacetylase n=1 Tax=Microbacterium sp. BWT-B31 TaxID=3232072 RepID=UPI0035270112